MRKLLIICGPTATGKTALALNFAKRFRGELVSADSRQIYKGLDIVTGKDIPENGGVKIWMYDLVDTSEQFSVSEYQRRAMPIISDIEKRGKLPIIVGGTGLYIDAIMRPFETIHIPPDRNIRKELEQMPLDKLQEKLVKLHQKRWYQMNQSDRHNPRRLIRAIEVALWKRHHKKSEEKNIHEFDALWIGLTMSMDKLAQKIRLRVAQRWEHGALEEGKRYPFAIALGIDQIRFFLSGTMSENEARARWAMAEIAYAKRQMTWFKKKKQIHWFDVSKSEFLTSVVERVAAWYTGTRDDKN